MSSIRSGTDYGTLAWPFNQSQGRHDGFEKPLLAWVPSVGISNLIRVDSPLFERWRGDLLVASLTGRPVVTEPIPIGYRMRDIIQGPDGSIVLKLE